LKRNFFRIFTYSFFQDLSDEIGCRPPVIIESPPPTVTVTVQTTLIINCTAIGIPTPEINWRLNWAHVPDKCKMTTTQLEGNKAFGRSFIYLHKIERFFDWGKAVSLKVKKGSVG